MVFSSSIFLFFFAPLFFISYFLLPAKYKNGCIFLSSLFFYAWGEAEIVFVMLGSVVVDYYSAKIIAYGRRKTGLAISILFNLGALFIFKYLNFTFDNFISLMEYLRIDSPAFLSIPHISLPIGISFYTFQTMSYTIDVYRGEVKASHRFVDFAAFVTMFPQLVAGPIVRYKDIEKSLQTRSTSLADVYEGFERIIYGLGKKVILADYFAGLADHVFQTDPAFLGIGHIAAGGLAYSFQIFFDFSGYSDMAIGLGRCLGFRFQENFNLPYTGTSIQDFWRRWHISLSTWFRDYLYIPLGGNRHSYLRTYINLLIVFIATGLWHGASWNFLLWGLYHGFFLILERGFLSKHLARVWKPLAHMYTLLVVYMGWFIFRLDDPDYARSLLQRLFNGSRAAGSAYSGLFNTLFVNQELWLMIVIAIGISAGVPGRISKKVGKRDRSVFSMIILSLVLLLSILKISVGSYSPFIYFRF